MAVTHTYRVTWTEVRTATIIAETKDDAIQKGWLKRDQETSWTSQLSSMGADAINEQLTVDP